MTSAARSRQTAIRRRHRPAGGTSIDAFTPRSVSGLLVWYDFSDPSTLYTDAGTTLVSADGDAVYQMNDKSGNAKNVTQATAGARPAYKTKIVNGRSVGRFDGGDGLASAATVVVKPVTLFVVMQVTNHATWHSLVGSSTDGLDVRIDQTTGKANALKQDTASLLIGTTGVTAATWYALSFTYDASGNAAHFTSGAANGTALNNQTLTTSTIRIGGNAGIPHLGDIAEVLYYDSVLTAANHNIVGNYLAFKYGLTWTTVT